MSDPAKINILLKYLVEIKHRFLLSRRSSRQCHHTFQYWNDASMPPDDFQKKNITGRINGRVNDRTMHCLSYWYTFCLLTGSLLTWRYNGIHCFYSVLQFLHFEKYMYKNKKCREYMKVRKLTWTKMYNINEKKFARGWKLIFLDSRYLHGFLEYKHLFYLPRPRVLTGLRSRQVN